MKITKNQLRRIIKEERNKLLKENYSYKPKADALKSAIAVLQSAAEYERRNSDVGEDEFLEEIITDLQNYLSSVLSLLNWET